MEDLIEKTYTEADANLVEFESRLVTFLDKEFKGCELHVDNPIPVINEHGDPLGTAVVKRGLLPPLVVVADFILNKNTPEVFDILQEVRSLYPHVHGGVREVTENGVTRITDVTIGAIQLLPESTLDDRIGPL